MSSILEALKKLEEEKAARRSGIGNLAGKVAKTGRRPRQTSRALVAGGMLAVALISISATYVAMNSTGSKRGDSTGRNVQTQPPPLPVAQQSTIGATAPSRESVGQPVIVTIKTDKVIPDRPGASPRGPGPRSSARQSNPTAPPQDSPAQPKAPGMAHPALTVSGIAWQKDNVNRMAVVNSTPLREDGVVEGAVVKEILPDRVRFSFDGKEFDVFLEK